jgi:hypothetical protein
MRGKFIHNIIAKTNIPVHVPGCIIVKVSVVEDGNLFAKNNINIRNVARDCMMTDLLFKRLHMYEIEGIHRVDRNISVDILAK